MFSWHRTRYAALVLGVAAALFLQSGVFANAGVRFVVDSPTDAVDSRVGDGVCRTVAGSCTLRAAIQEANARPGADDIQVPAGSYEIGIPPLNQNDVTTGDLDVTDSLAISGTGAGSTIIDGGAPPAGAPPQVHGLDRLFEVSVDGGTVSFSGVTLRDGYTSEHGGAVANNSTASVTVTSADLTSNVAGKSGGALDNHLGGAMDVRDSTVTGNFAYENGSALNNNRDGVLTVSGSDISSNSAAAVGLDEALVGAGAISNNAELDTIGTIAVSRSRISDNRAGGGRAGATITNDGAGTVTVDDTTFTKNQATGDGGAIFNSAGDVTVTGSTFSENAANDGGAIYSGVKEGRLTVSGSTFSLNTATGRGGAIMGGGAGSVMVSGSAFSKNSADGWGGAILNDDKGSAAVDSSSFSENSGLNGGGLANDGTGLVTVENSTFAKNAALAASVLSSGEGGGLHSNSVGDVVVTGGAFTENTARSGGGLSNEGGGTLEIAGTRFAANHAEEQGGGILIQSGAVRLLNIDVIGNSADSAIEAGGGISYQGDKLASIGETAAIEDSRIRDNKAKGPGGGIDSRGDGPLAITTTTISGNTAGMGGGIHHVGDAPLELGRSTVAGNFAESGGGVFSDGDGEASLRNTTVSGNRAGQFGGGLLVSSRLTITSSTVAGNTAAVGGGINNGGGDLVGDGSVFLTNTIVANSPTGGNCAGTITSAGGNLDSANTCRLSELSDQPGTDPRLGPLADNGGPTRTHALMAASPAQERAVCTEADPCPPEDQRGLDRPQFEGFDVGAYESELAPGGAGDSQPCAGRTERPVRPDFDSWVKQSSPNANFGNESILKVESQAGANERALVHFPLPPVPPGCKLVGAKLRLYSSAATAGRRLEALRVTSDWNELGVAWANQPGTAGPAAASESGLGSVEWDVLAQALDMYVHGDHGFLIRDSAENGLGEQSFHSTEKGADNPPELVLVYDDPDAPARPGSCPTTPQILSADRDSWVSQGSPTNNFGTDSTLKVKSQLGYNSRALVRFPLPALPAGCTSVASATLRLDAASAKEGHTLDALRVASAWTEAGVTWDNQPATTGGAASTPSAQGPLEWAVREHLLDMYTSGNHGFLIRDADENGVGDEQSLHSRDKVNDGPPELVLAFDDSTPETAIDHGPPSPTDSTEATFRFSSDRQDATFECSLDGAAFRACTSPYAVGGLSEADHALEVRATQRIRAVDPTPARYDWRVAIPPRTTVAGPASPSASPDATVTFSADDPAATFECSLNGAAFEPCTSAAEYTNLADGPNEVRVQATDPHGNVEPTPARHAWTVAVPPETTIDSGPPALGNSSSASFTFSGTDNGPAPAPLAFECRLDAGEWAACTSGQTYSALTDGPHTFEVRATDRAGNSEAEPASRTWTVDTVAPDTTIDSAPGDPTNSPAARFEFGAGEAASFECRLDEGEWGACTTGRAYSGLADGRHSFAVRATDRAGNGEAEPASHSWTVDMVAPDTTINETPADPTNDPAARFEFSAGEAATFECKLDAGEWVACTSGQSYAALADGQHTFSVQATDAAKNQEAEAASYSWTVDTVAPDTTIGSAPEDPTNDSAARFEFTATEAATFECRLDEGEWSGCTSGQSYAALADGRHSFSVKATDAAGNQEAEPVSYSWTVDTVAPDTTIGSAPEDPTNDSAARFEFSTAEAATFECRLDEGEWAACTSGQAYAGLADGRHTFSVHATDSAGNREAEPASYSWTVDTVAPDTTIDGAPEDPTNDPAASFEFSAGETATFECKLDAGEWVSCSSGQSYAALADGRHTFSVRATDAAGNGEAEPASYSWTVDTVAPDTTIDSTPADPSNDRSPTFGFSAGEAASFECQLDESGWAPCSSGDTFAGLADGPHTFSVRATDAAGNGEAEPASYTWTVDTVAPDTTIGSSPPHPTNDSAARFEFGATEAATFECRLDAGEWVACTTGQSYAALADGGHTFSVQATDSARNQEAEPASYSWTVDTVAPDTTINETPADPTNDRAARFEFSAGEAASFECRLDTGEWGACTSGQAYAGLTDGRHTFSVQATDAAGNQEAEPAAYSWTVDTVAPDTSIDRTPADPSNDRSPAFGFSAVEAANFECRLDEGGWAPCSSGHTFSEVADGRHTFSVQATDAAGNGEAEPASYSWTVDTVAPDTTVKSGPPDPTNDPAARFEFGATEAASFECRLDAGEWVSCSRGQAYPGLADGRHTFSVGATDAAGNGEAEPASYSWTVDTTAPDTTIGSAPEDPTNDPAPRFEFGAGETATFECKLDAGDWAACTSGQAYAGLADGRHTFSVRATDSAGNPEAESASYGWTVDTVAPDTTIGSAPEDPTNSPAASFAFSAGEAASFECKLDAGEWAACASGQAYAGLANGRHTFSVRATDRAGNGEAEPASYSWTVDTVAPETTIDTGPADPARSSAASFGFHASEAASFECRLDTGDWGPCTSPHELTGLTQGEHTFRVRATDLAANVGEPASYSWTVDTVAPDTGIDSAPANPSSDSAARFEFSASETATFECKLDAGEWAACSSPQLYTGLADGTHTFSVRATDLAGNGEAEPASYTWTIEPPRDTIPPDTRVTGGPANPSNTAVASFTFTGTDNATPPSTIAFECRLDSQAPAAFVSCSSPKTYSSLSEGSHTFEVRAVDGAGNRDATPATFTWTVDTTAPQTTITAAPPATTTSTSASFSFTTSEPGAGFECSLDGAAFGACSSPRGYAGLTVGGHQFSVRSKDAAGNLDASPATHSWTISPPGCGPASTALAAADAWVDENSPTNNKGADSILKVQSKGPRDNFRALVRFALPAVPEGCVIQSATLRVFAASAKPGRTLQALRLASTWAENQVNWSNQPLTTGAAATTASGSGYLEWIVTSQLQAMYAGSNNGFLIRDASEGQDAEQQFHAREKGESPPQLVVRVAAAGG
jgi:predicted outer membrane repeat protein